jgi:murein DD-endopeptidase MepM/ murein hydrolase activator NlpD
LLATNGGERFFVGTPGKTWQAGTHGYVRSEGLQMHEGWDIRCLERNKAGEPTDVVSATANGVVAHVSTNAALSSYGRYVVICHQVDGIEVYSLYAHLSKAWPGLAAGQPVTAGQPIGVMGRSANTRSGISRERAHVHFEIALLINDRYESWHRKSLPGYKNHHGKLNGHNLIGLDPALALIEPLRLGTNYNLMNLIRTQRELCRVQVRATDFPWLKRYAPLVTRNPKAEAEGVAGYEIALNSYGVPFQLTPRSTSEMVGEGLLRVVSVNEAEYELHPVRLISRRDSGWALQKRGRQLLELLIE